MPAHISAGLLMYQRDPDGGLSVLLAHPGGPFFRNKDDGSWTIPKGLVDQGEEHAAAARREFNEETGITPPPDNGALVPLGEIQQRGGKRVHAWAFLGSLPPGFVLASGHFTMEWPPRSGKSQSFPEIDRVEMFSMPVAMRKIIAAQAPFLERLVVALVPSV